MARPRFAVLLLALGLGVLPAVRADDIDEAEEKLAKAREAHAEEMSKVREAVAKLIDDKVAAEEKRSNPDLNRIEALQAERDAVEDGDLSKSKSIDAKLKKRVADANRKLAASLLEAKRA